MVGSDQDQIEAESFFAADSSEPYEIAEGTWTPEPGTLGAMLLALLALAGGKTARRIRLGSRRTG